MKQSLNESQLKNLRHDTAHLLAEAVKELYPTAQVAIGPAIENGFYYDFDYAEAFTPDDLSSIEQRMLEIIKRSEPIVREEWSRLQAIGHFTASRLSWNCWSRFLKVKALACTGKATFWTCAEGRMWTIPQKSAAPSNY